MGDLGFAKSFNMIRSGKDHAYIDGLRRFMTLFGSVSNAPWACRIALTLPWIADGWKTFLKFCADTMEERQKVRLPISRMMDQLTSAGVTNQAGCEIDLS